MSSIGLIGAGAIGSVLAKRLVRVGHTVKIANSRGRDGVRDIANRARADAADLDEVATDVDVLIVAIPLGQAAALPSGVTRGLRPDAVIIDTGNYVPPRDGRIEAIEAGLPETAWVAGRLGAPVVKAFNNITDHSLEHGGRPAGAADRIALPVAGDDPQGKATSMRLVEDLGFDAIDAGSLAESWRQQLGQPAYAVDPTREELRDLLARADRETLARNRGELMALMATLPLDMTKAQMVAMARDRAGLKPARKP